MRINCATDIGPVRTSNQDSCDCGSFSLQSAWAVVCDGMGGANGGDVASTTAVREIRDIILSEFDGEMTADKIKDMMLRAVEKANQAVYRLSKEREELFGMGTTVVLMIADRGRLYTAHVGDSRAYLCSDHQVRQLTVDHSYVQDLVNLGQITPEEAKTHPQRNIITRVLGVHEQVQCDYQECAFSKGDMAIACSDGLSNYIEEQELLAYMEKYREDGELLTKALIRHAVEQGGSDNITAAVLADT